MRFESAKHYATQVTQYERISGGKAWDNPDNALAINGNVGAAVDSVVYTNDETRPFGPDYVWTAESNTDDTPIQVTDIDPTLEQAIIADGGHVHHQGSGNPHVPDGDDHRRFPNGLRFSGFNINDAGITGDCVVTNLTVYLEYSDDSLIDGYSTVQHGKRNYTNWIIRPVKSGGIHLCHKRFDGEGSTTGRVIRTVRIPCKKDQHWHSNTYGPDIVEGRYLPGQRFRAAVEGWIDEPGHYGNHYCNEYYEAVDDIKSLTVAEINDPNFYIDVWHARFRRTSGHIKVHSLAISVEYVKNSSCMAIVYCHGTAYHDDQKSCRSVKFGPNSKPWANPWKGAVPDASLSTNGIDVVGNFDTNVDVFQNPVPIHNTGSVNDQLVRFDTDMLIGRLDAIPNIDDTTQSITDMILDVRHNGYVHGVYKRNTPRIRWSYFLLDGLNQTDAATLGDPIHKHKMQIYEPGIRVSYSQPGQDWLRHTGGYNLHEREYYGVEDNWHFRHFPVKRFNPHYSVEMVNTVSFPGASYDPLWIEKALKAGRLYIGLVLSVDPGLATYHTLHPKPRWNLRVNSIRLRVFYTCAGEAPTGGNNLIVRYTP